MRFFASLIVAMALASSMARADDCNGRQTWVSIGQSDVPRIIHHASPDTIYAGDQFWHMVSVTGTTVPRDSLFGDTLSGEQLWHRVEIAQDTVSWAMVESTTPAAAADALKMVYGYMPQYTVVARYVVTATAYNSRRNQTDSTPWFAHGNYLTRPGIIACNFLPRGTLVRFPGLFDGWVFTVEDAMNERYNVGYVDIWMPRVEDAYRWGHPQVTMEVLGPPNE